MTPYVLVLHRWVHGQAEYDRYPRPGGADLVFVAATSSVHRMPAGARMVRTVRSMDDTARVLQVVADIVGHRGRPARIVALDEADLMTAARARQAHDVPGHDVERTLMLGDRLQLLDRVLATRAVPVPEFAGIRTAQEVHDFAARTGYPVVVKPRAGAGGQGLQLVDHPGEPVEIGAPAVVQRFCAADVVHVDGWWDGTTLATWQPSFSVDGCAPFRADPMAGRSLGSCEITDPDTRERIRAATIAVCRALCGDQPLVVRLELLVTDACVSFLDLGHPVDGAEVPTVWREVHGLDLVEVAWSVQLGLGIDPDRAPLAPGPKVQP